VPKRHPDFHRIERQTIELGPAPDSSLIPDEAIEILYVDEHIIVVNKPSGLLSVPGKTPDKADCLIARMQKRWADALTVHRLDQATSGVVVLARGKAAHRHLSMQFEARTVQKRYEAVADGMAEQDSGTINAPIGDDLTRRPLRIIDPVHGRPSVTHWQVLSRDAEKNCTHFSLKPETGRTHQIRVHLAHIGHAIWGDHLYGSPEVYAKSARLLLHAAELSFAHPASGASGARASFSASWLPFSHPPNLVQDQANRA
jgi:tRNA pseudouridine32 synthase / 23S rRNA pseudouridine746 synthase